MKDDIEHKEQIFIQRITPEVFNSLLRDSKNYSGLLKATGYYKDDFPWIFEFCTFLVPLLKSKESKEKKIEAINDFLYDLKNTVKKPELKQLHSINEDLRSNYTRSYIYLKQYLGEIVEDL